MPTTTKYVIFRTRWGYFGLAGAKSGLCRTCLAEPKRAAIEAQLLANGSALEFDKGFFKPLQEQIASYYDGSYVDFGPEIPICLDGYTRFGISVLKACRKIRPGRTMSYAELAGKAGRPRAARAVGGALARNPLPLIIPCHRVLGTDGGLGGFSAPGGVAVKKRMLELERRALSSGRTPEYA